jgi:hypothetical protein
LRTEQVTLPLHWQKEQVVSLVWEGVMQQQGLWVLAGAQCGVIEESFEQQEHAGEAWLAD